MNIPIMFDLSKKVALVTGASRGIGAATARLLAEFGADVIMTSRKEENLKNISSQIENLGYNTNYHICNNGDLNQIKILFKKIHETHGRLDILINNAATNPFLGPVTEADEKRISRFSKIH